jgi:hypothetical protein
MVCSLRRACDQDELPTTAYRGDLGRLGTVSEPPRHAGENTRASPFAQERNSGPIHDEWFEAYEYHRATGVSKDGRRFGAGPNPYVAPELPPRKINVTDLDSRNVKTPRSYTQGYNVQAVVNEQQIVLAAEVTLSSPVIGHLEPMLSATRRELEQVGVSDTPGVALADSGYWHEQ